MLIDAPDKVPITLSEPNALLLDTARWRWEGEAWEEPEELLRIEDAVRRRVGLPLRRSYNAQPWSDQSPCPELGRLELLFSITCDAPVLKPVLALERPDLWRVVLDGWEVGSAASDWWIDDAIKTLPLPSLAPGEHRLSLSTMFTRRGALECCYLLGDFGVRLNGAAATVVEAPARLAWGDWTVQGLPFYTGNVTYHLPFQLPGAGGRAGPPSTSSRTHCSAWPSTDCDVGPLAFAPLGA